jgi:CRISPR-associated protein Csd1
MILTALKELAEREGLTENPDYQPMPVRWLIDIGPGGELLGVADTLQKPESGRGKPEARKVAIPKRSKRTSGVLSEFIVDKPVYVFGWVHPDKLEGVTDQDEQDLKDKAAERHKVYINELRLACDASADLALSAWLAFFESPAAQSSLPDWTEGDLIAPRFYADGGPLLSDRASVREYWAVRRRQAECGTGEPSSNTPTPVGDRAYCVVTGELCVPQRLHPSIKGIPPVSDTKGGVPLTSINAAAFNSYGLGDIGCVPISPQAADAYQSALNRLLADGYPDPHTQGGKLPNRNARLSDSAIVVFWSKKDAIVDLFADAIAHGEPAHVEAIFKATWKGKSISLEDPSAFYALTLSGAQGRGTVRGWHETTLGAVIKNIQMYFNDLEITRDESKPRPLLSLLRQMAVLGKVDNIPPNLAGEVFQAVLGGRSLPRSVLDALLRRTRAERTLFSDRAAFIKACLCRTRRDQLRNDDPDPLPEVTKVVDEKCPNAAYRLGRLFAVLERIQKEATNAAATIRDRYYGAASATPAVVFPQLLRKAPHHLPKSNRPKFYEKLLQEIQSELQPPTPFPKTLMLDQQGLFAIGYYHEAQALFDPVKNAERKARYRPHKKEN